MYQQVKDHIIALSDSELIEYVLMGRRMYEPDAVAFAKDELNRRSLSSEQMTLLREPIIAKVLAADADGSSRQWISMEPAVVCERCGFEVPTKYMEYGQQIGLLLVRFGRRYKGRFCKRCSRQLFVQTSLITLCFGWWGIVSFFVTIVYLIENPITFLRNLSMPPVPPGSGPPHFDESVIARIAPYISRINEGLVGQRDENEIANELAPQAGVTPGQVWCYIQHLRHVRLQYRSIATPIQTPTYGFPVQVPLDTPAE